MSVVREITINAIPNNTIGKRPRKPLVHLMSLDGMGELNSIAFHPRFAAKVIAAIRKQAAAALAGKKSKSIEFELSED